MRHQTWIAVVVALLVVGTQDGLRAQGIENTAGRGQSYALLIGVNDYNPPFSDLRFCHHDMEALCNTLISAGIPQENVTVMHDGASRSMHWPSKSNIESQLRLRLSLANESDFVVVAFSGHGVHLGDTSYLCPCDVSLDRPADTMVSLDYLYEQLEQCRAAVKLLLVDACRNEPLVDSVRAPSGFRSFTEALAEPPSGIHLLTSCEPGQRSAEDAELKHGVFMHYVVRGLEGLADKQYEGNRNGKISLGELYAYAHEKTKVHVANELGILQRPMLKGQHVGVYEFSFASVRDLTRVRLEPDAEPEPEVDADPEPKTGGSAQPDSTTASAPRSELLKQADRYFSQGDFDRAIEAYAAVIRNDYADAAVVRDAHLARGAAYLAKGGREDLEYALVDYLAAGQKAMPLIVTAPKAQLKLGSKVTGTVVKNQVLYVSASNDAWFWVVSVGGNVNLKGYVNEDAVASRPESESVAARSGVPTQRIDPVAGSGGTCPISPTPGHGGCPPKLFPFPIKTPEGFEGLPIPGIPGIFDGPQPLNGRHPFGGPQTFNRQPSFKARSLPPTPSRRSGPSRGGLSAHLRAAAPVVRQFLPY
ncbi:MAG: caspase family protein [Planctomycetota bacterium]|jgi:hypothetical protein